MTAQGITSTDNFVVAVKHSSIKLHIFWHRKLDSEQIGFVLDKKREIRLQHIIAYVLFSSIVTKFYQLRPA